jgi:hypothetical protein
VQYLSTLFDVFFSDYLFHKKLSILVVMPKTPIYSSHPMAKQLGSESELPEQFRGDGTQNLYLLDGGAVLMPSTVNNKQATQELGAELLFRNANFEAINAVNNAVAQISGKVTSAGVLELIEK